MTAAVWDGKTISADRRIRVNETIVSDNTKKIYKWARGIFASSGRHGIESQLSEWLTSDRTIKLKVRGTWSMLYSEDGRVYYCSDSCDAYEAFIPYGIGDGGEEAEVLCKVGFSGPDAIKEVMRWNVSVGGKVDSVKIGK